MLFSSACAIAEEDTKTVVITGGADANGGQLKNAIRYGLDGWKENLEELNTARKRHACTSYISGGERVILV